MESPSISNNKRIAKNTMYMYFRMFFIMCVNLYISRIVLKELGFVDYGLYNVVGGIIAMFAFINGAMTNTTSRFITFHLGKNDEKRLKEVFAMSEIIHIIIAFVIVVLGETLGLYYLYHKLVVPENRFFAVFCLYQLSIVSSAVNIVTVPYNATIVAHEKMSAFAYISIIDAVLKLIFVALICYYPYDKLIYYGFCMFFVQMLDLTIYWTYCKKHFKETNFKWFWEKPLFRDMFGFAGWSLFGNFSFIFFTEGLNLLLNAFCGPAVNAARGIAVQVDNVVRNFASNIQVAINPQIIKSYAQSDMDRMFMLIFASSRYCFYLLLLLSLPLMIETDYVLSLWLVKYPEHTVNFLRITLVIVVLEALVSPMFTANLASGKVKIYQITLSIISYSFIPITYLAIKLTKVPEIVFVCTLVMTIFEICARVVIINRQIGMPVGLYVKNVFLNIGVISVLVPLAPVLVHMYLPMGFIRLICTSVVSVLSVLTVVLAFGLKANERQYVYSYLKNKILNGK